MRLTVDDGARLVLQDGSVLLSQSLTVEGLRVLERDVGGEESGRFVLTSAVATGQVSIEGAQGKLFGSEATLEFDSLGSPSLLTITGSPRANLVVQSANGEPANVSVEGAGPLIVVAGSTRRFELAGPAVATWDEAEVIVRASDWIRGSLDEDSEETLLQAWGSVRVVHPEATLEGPSLVVDYSRDTEATDDIHLTVPGPSHFEGVDEEGHRLFVDAIGQMMARTRRVKGVEQDQIFLERAESVTARYESPDKPEENFTAICGVLREVVVADRTFVGEGGVTYEVEGGRAVGARVIANGEKDFELFGSFGSPAIFRTMRKDSRLKDIDSIVAQAVYLHVTPDRVEAQGEVDLKLTAKEREFEALAEKLVFQWLAPEDLDQEPRPFRLTATLIDRAGMRGGGDDLSLSCSNLEVNGSLNSEAEQNRLGPLDLVAQGSVRVELAGRTRELSDDFAGTSTLIGFGERFTWSVQEGLDNEGSAAVDWKGGVGRLSTDRGKRVRSVGNLAGEQLPYEMTADWIDFTSERVEAMMPRLRIDSTDLPTSTGPGASKEDQTFEATAQHLVGTRKQIRMNTTSNWSERLLDATRGPSTPTLSRSTSTCLRAPSLRVPTALSRKPWNR